MPMGSPGIALGQFFAMLPDPQKQAERRQRRLVPDPGAEGCGCCPACHDFVYAQFTQPGGRASCPSCGGLIDVLDPLADRPS